ncbi:Uncharacterized protein C24B11.08c [Taphrina deformans PYCC 5710]|uniref:Endoplasmic reticulum-Golgi intermediate compartment protein n=1 Tax=Taphrina deformans (strain PYCC 5710 / ATCC 11124 / CBS 356.35 / IMI 108563 / JCM 9778 / NBRC 8474) TaxID=1097556 RepID=R4XCG4_TAPDE|nr:Uncharacterized protein C24B11.08c [Taphrina deformans PYCC 5710]|eukprot:CCG81010.1 Uncharacterized protein C24B11.08c [Taphrina deformans PYCC 5710]
MGRRFQSFDVFEKVASEAQIKTSSGGIVTISSLFVIFFLLVSEWNSYRKIVVAPELMVDTSRQERMSININMTFASIPCSMLSLDLMDTAGEQQHNIEHDVAKTRLTPEGQMIDSTKLALGSNREKPLHDASYCGPCYGAKPDSECCNTCESVRDAYAAKGWSIDDLDALSQCKEEHYKEKLVEQSHEGCNIAGSLHVNKVIGNFHLAPGRSIQTQEGTVHVHDIQQFLMDPAKHSFAHQIHHLSFGPPFAGLQHSNPLDGVEKVPPVAAYNYVYFLKCVATSSYKLHQTEPLETMTYSVTAHERPTNGGVDKDNPNHVNMRGGIPGVFFSYDISPLKLIEREERGRFSSFLVGAMSSIGGVIAVASFFDRAAYEVQTRSKKD